MIPGLLELPDDAVDDHGVGWAHYLERLSVRVTGGDPGPDRASADPRRFDPVVHVASLLPAAIEMIGDLERCLFWTMVEIASEHTQEKSP